MSARDAAATADLVLRAVPKISEIDPAAWNACANPRVTAGPRPESEACGTASEHASGSTYNPFISHEFLSALEDSGSAVARTGWQPQHLVAEAPGGGVAG